jgi:hypothetical protein
VHECIAGIDLEDVVDQEPLCHFEKVDRSLGILLEAKSHNREVPTVLRAVLAPGLVAQNVLPEDVFEFVDFEEKTELIAQTLLHGPECHFESPMVKPGLSLNGGIGFSLTPGEG